MIEAGSWVAKARVARTGSKGLSETEDDESERSRAENTELRPYGA